MKDNFSKQANVYAQYRPQYPQELFDYILSFVKEKNTAWDCGTGNGQSTRILSQYFKKVLATDISQQQLDNAYRAGNIDYSLQRAEKTNFNDNSIDLVTVSQALHWFHFTDFYAEVKRVAKPGAIIAVWTYSLLHISDAIDEIIRHYHNYTLGAYWDEERKYVDAGYKTVPFPFPEIAAPPFSIKLYWTLKDLEGYLHTWSALQKYLQQHQINPVTTVIKGIEEVWGGGEKREIIFPLHLRLGTIK
ncbi:MAG: class I SAM-dependent methyltransferase [Bacteroidetes bacterium]|nr:class I SAM-dependent methyltransferase [Bacteroidota bacterium]